MCIQLLLIFQRYSLIFFYLLKNTTPYHLNIPLLRQYQELKKKITNRTDLLFWIFLRSHKGIVRKATVTVGLWGDVLWEWRSPLGEALQARFSLWRHEAWWTHPAHPKDYAHESTANSFWEGSAREWGVG